MSTDQHPQSPFDMFLSYARLDSNPDGPKHGWATALSPTPELPIPSAFLRPGGQLEQAHGVTSDSSPALQAQIAGYMNKVAFETITELLAQEQP